MAVPWFSHLGAVLLLIGVALPGLCILHAAVQLNIFDDLPFCVPPLHITRFRPFLQGRGELSVYHDLPGLATTTLAADVQTSGAAVAGEAAAAEWSGGLLGLAWAACALKQA